MKARIPLRIRLPFADEAEFLARYGQHVAPGGIFVSTRTPKETGTLLSFEFVLADGARLLRGEGVVERVTEAETGPTGMLLRFTRVDARTKALLDHVATQRGEAPDNSPVVSSASGFDRPATPETAPDRDAALLKSIDDALKASQQEAKPPEPEPPKPSPVRPHLTLAPPPSSSAPRVRARPSAPAPPSKVSLPVAVVGIDLSTLGTRLAQAREGEFSLVAVTADGQTVSPARFSADGTHDVAGTISLGTGWANAQNIRHLTQSRFDASRAFAEGAMGATVSEAVVAVPGWLSSRQRADVVAGLADAGVTARLVNQATAAAVHFAAGKGLARKRALVFSLGAGGFDVQVVELTGDDLDVVSAVSDPTLGGLALDVRLAQAFAASVSPGIALTESELAMVSVALEPSKRALQTVGSVAVNVAFANDAGPGGRTPLLGELTRDLLNAVSREPLERCLAHCRVALEGARLLPQQLDAVLCIGGGSQAADVQAALQQLTQKTPADLDPLLSPALGAARLAQAHAARTRGKRAGSVSEVLTRAVSVATPAGALQPVFERNTRLPAEKRVAFHSPASGAVVSVWAGEGSTREATALGSFAVPASERPTAASLHLQLLADGRLEGTVSWAGQQLPFESEMRDQIRSPFADAPVAPVKRGVLSGLKRLWRGE
jgi:molecular chaperone DnaK